jgi:hypothetical protein
MSENMAHCKYLLSTQYAIDGGTDFMPGQWKCRLNEMEIGGLDKCQQTPVEGPCYQYSSMTPKEWNDYVKQRLQELESG